MQRLSYFRGVIFYDTKQNSTNVVISHEIMFTGSERCYRCKSNNLDSIKDKVRIKCSKCGKIYPEYSDVHNSNSNLLFGYGSLILPTSLVSRFNNFDIKTKQIYSKNNSIGYVRAEALMSYENSGISFLPCKIKGFNRTYTFNSKRGGNMIECSYTGNNNHFINGFMYSGLSKKQLDLISDSEEEHYLEEANTKEFHFYKNDIKPSNVYINISRNNPSGNSKNRNQIYHNRILTGIKILKDKYDSNLRDIFLEDFKSSIK